MLNLALMGFVALIAAMGLKRPFLWVLLYIYVDIVTPQKVGWGFLTTLPLSQMVFVLAFGGWLLLDAKDGVRVTFRQGLIVALLIWCGLTTLMADYPEAAAAKWDWVWKSLFFAAFLPLTLRTWLRVEATALVMVLAAGSIIISAGIKTLLSGGGYGTLQSLVRENAGLYEGSTLSTVAVAMIPLILWVSRHGSVFPRAPATILFGLALAFAALLVPVGTQTRTGLVCIAVLAVLALRQVRYRFVFAGAAAAALAVALPFLPASYLERMATLTQTQADQSASTRVQVWRWTIDYALDNPLGGGFDSYLGNSFTYETRRAEEIGGSVIVQRQTITEESRAFHSAYFELLGEQGFVGLGLWLWLHALGLVQMERIRRRYRASAEPLHRKWRSLATALQHGQIVYLVGALFIGVGYQPFMFLLLGLQIALTSLVRREEAASTLPRARPAAALGAA